MGVFIASLEIEKKSGRYGLYIYWQRITIHIHAFSYNETLHRSKYEWNHTTY